MSPRVSHLDNDQCRTCTSFADYMKENRKKLKQETGDEDVCLPEEAPEKVPRADCPVDKDQLGRNSWALLHTIAAKYPDNPTDENKSDIKTFFSVFSKIYPCNHCAKDLREDLVVNPPKVDCQKQFSLWLCNLHNRINEKVGKPLFDCARVDERWKTGWSDGSCDF